MPTVTKRLLAGLVLLTSGISGSSAAEPAAELEGIYLKLSYTYGVGGAVYPTYRPYMLFRDGSICRNLEQAPVDLDPAASRRNNPKEWGRWRKEGEALTVQWNGEDEVDAWKKYHVALPGEPGQQLAGRYAAISGGGDTAFGGASSIAAWTVFEFQPGGKFQMAKGGGGYVAGATGGSVASSSNSQTAGAYSIDGYNIELVFPDGTRQRTSFFLYPKGPKTIGIGGRNYSRRE